MQVERFQSRQLHRTPRPARVQTDSTSGNVYVTWGGIIVPPAGNPQGALFNPNPILMTAFVRWWTIHSSPPLPVNTSAYGPDLRSETHRRR